MQLHIIRHGQTEWNATGRIQGQADSSLDRRGIEQSLEAAAALAAIPFVSAWISPLGRTRQTAELLLAGRSDVPRFLDDRLQEITLGVWDGRLWEEVRQEDPINAERLVSASPDFQIPGAETHQQVGERALSVLADITSTRGGTTASKAHATAHEKQPAQDRHQHQDDAREVHVLVVSHGAWIKNLLLLLLGRDLGQRPAFPSIPNCARSLVRVDESKQLIVVDVADGLWQLDDGHSIHHRKESPP